MIRSGRARAILCQCGRAAAVLSLSATLASAAEYCTPNYDVAPLPNTQSGNLNSTDDICFVVENAGPLGFNCSNMQGRTVTVNGTPYSSSTCAGSVTVPDANGGQYYFDVSAGGLAYASVAFWAGSGSGGSDGSAGASGSCTATLSAGTVWNDRYNLIVSVTGSDNWRVKMTLRSPAVMVTTWNIDPYWPPPGNTLIAAPNGKGNNWGVTIKHNGNWTWPTVTCEAFDNPFAQVHTKTATCENTTPTEHPSDDYCSPATGYALTGGGAHALYSGAGAFLTRSRPAIDESGFWRWQTASQDLIQIDSHMLTTYTVGLRLDGVNTARLRDLIALNGMAFPPAPGTAARPTGSLSIGPMTLGGGAYTETSGPGQLLTRTMANGNVWDVASKEHLVASPGRVNAVTLTLPQGIIEGFGALQVRQVKATPTAVGGGVGTSIGEVSPGWQLVSLGAEATTTSGPGRMLFRIGVDESGRTVTVQSKDYLSTSAGQTAASWIEVHKVPGSHGMCNPGTALLPSMDACVAQICSADAHCCQTQWDSTCVAKVTSICGRSCEDYTCSSPTYNPDYWNDGGTIQNGNNCYNYATNTRTDSDAQPGSASGAYCAGKGGCPGASVAPYAVNDGLIPTTLAAGCPGNLSLVALFDSGWDYHWYRRDWYPLEKTYKWSSKNGNAAATNKDASGQVITDIESFDRGVYNQLVGYYCTCSSSTEGQGHAEIE